MVSREIAEQRDGVPLDESTSAACPRRVIESQPKKAHFANMNTHLDFEGFFRLEHL
jgi:hypothetical protein